MRCLAWQSLCQRWWHSQTECGSGGVRRVVLSKQYFIWKNTILLHLQSFLEDLNSLFCQPIRGRVIWCYMSVDSWNWDALSDTIVSGIPNCANNLLNNDESWVRKNFIPFGKGKVAHWLWYKNSTSTSPDTWRVGLEFAWRWAWDCSNVFPRHNFWSVPFVMSDLHTPVSSGFPSRVIGPLYMADLPTCTLTLLTT